MEATDFTKEEVQEISKHILGNVPYSVLEQIFPLTENPRKKAEVFTIMYRIIYSSVGYVKSNDTKSKLKNLLTSCEIEYKEIYNILLKLDSSVEFGSTHLFNKVKIIFSDFDKNFKINNLIDVFLVFAEKQILRDIDKVVGVTSDNIKGEQIVKELGKLVKV